MGSLPPSRNLSPDLVAVVYRNGSGQMGVGQERATTDIFE